MGPARVRAQAERRCTYALAPLAETHPSRPFTHTGTRTRICTCTCSRTHTRTRTRIRTRTRTRTLSAMQSHTHMSTARTEAHLCCTYSALACTHSRAGIK
eukprot:5227453-Pleurochrysis_carterae.AAC.1